MVFSIGVICIKISAQLDLPVHNIDTDLDYATIQEAIDSPETLDGHTILVEDGIYYEHIVVNKAVRLLGANRSTTIIDGNGTEQVVSLKANGAEIAGFTVQNGRWGIDLHYVQNASVTENKVFNCSYRGIFLYGCSKSGVSNNTIMSTNMGGIELWKSHGIVITNNTVANTSHGIYLLINSTKNSISNNFVTNNPQGIALSINCNNNTIVGNTVTSSNVGGIVMGGAHNNTIYHNNIIDNPKPFFSYEGSSNFWDDGTEGNFWDDYPGLDLNGNGIGDIPYVIDVNNKDRYPLITPVVWDYSNPIPVVWENMVYKVVLCGNSTISMFQFNQPKMRISFNVKGQPDTMGSCNVTIPISLLGGPYTGKVSSVTVLEDYSPPTNGTHAFIYFTYNHSSHTVEIIGTTVIPEFPSLLILPLLMIPTVVTVVFSKKKR